MMTKSGSGSHFARFLVVSALTISSLASYAEAQAPESWVEAEQQRAAQLRQVYGADAELYARKLLQNPGAKETVGALRNLLQTTDEVRSIYYDHVVKVARSYLETEESGPYAGAARLLLCGGETCEPARYASPERLADSQDKSAFIEEGGTRPGKLSTPPPKYPRIARKAGIEGLVVVQAIITEQGQATDVVVLKGLPLGLSESAVSAVERWRFSPATLDGEPMDAYYNLKVNFELR